MGAPSDPRKLRERKLGLLWFGERQADRWSITDPESDWLASACQRLRPSHFGDGYAELSPEERQKRNDLYTVLRAVDDYRHLTTYELGVEHIIKKLRIIWRALREAREGKGSDGGV